MPQLPKKTLLNELKRLQGSLDRPNTKKKTLKETTELNSLTEKSTKKGLKTMKTGTIGETKLAKDDVKKTSHSFNMYESTQLFYCFCCMAFL